MVLESLCMEDTGARRSVNLLHLKEVFSEGEYLNRYDKFKVYLQGELTYIYILTWLVGFFVIQG